MLSAGTACALAGLLLGGAAANARPATGGSWTVAPSANGLFSVETPCTVSEVVKSESLPASLLPDVKFSDGSRVICSREKVVLVAGEVSEANFPATGPSLFDMVIEQAKGDKTAEGTPSITTIGGRRAFINRQEKDGMLAQTGFVEVGRAKIILLIAGVEGSSGLSINDQAALIDHFYSSVKVIGK